LAVVGFDDIPLAEHSHPSLTTVHQPIYDIGKMVCRMLIQLIKNQDPDQRQVMLEPGLVIRESSGLNGPATVAPQGGE
ncbi:MAG: substrate-binding domain-containing protein, partial [Anaerolineae bacterium]